MRYIYVILTVLILSSACKSQTSPNTPGQIILPASPNTPAVVQPTPPPTTIQPTTSPSDETIRIARAEMERDAARDAKEAYKDNAISMWAALGAIVTLIGIFGVYIGFKNDKAYKEALQQTLEALKDSKDASKEAKDACKEARHWEAEAKQILGSIDKQVKEELEKIKKQGKESIEDVVKQTQTQMRVSELWSNALNLHNQGKYEEACDKYAELAKLTPKIYEVYYNWGIALWHWAKLKGDEKLFELARQKFEMAVKIKPDMPGVYYNWGSAILELAKLKKNTPEEYDKLLKQGEEKCLKAESLKKGEGAYNLACLCAIRGNKEECRRWMLAGQEANTLDTRENAMKDSDLDSVKNEAWFKEIKWKGER